MRNVVLAAGKCGSEFNHLITIINCKLSAAFSVSNEGTGERRKKRMRDI